MQFIDRLESKFGRFAIPGLIKIIATFQLTVLGMLILLPTDSANAYIDLLRFDRNLVLSGQVWRMVTDVLVLDVFFTMKSVFGMVFWGFIGARIMMFFASGLEQEWGIFRTNLYVLGWFLVSWVFGFGLGAGLGGMLLASSILFAFASLFPNQELMLFFVLPVKMKWIAWLAAGMMMFQVMDSPLLLIVFVPGHLNYLFAFVPYYLREFKHSSKVADRRARFAAGSAAAAAFFHQCSVCKKTEIDNPQLDFRVLDSGDEICDVCRAKRAA